jgi:hypothetical protein
MLVMKELRRSKLWNTDGCVIWGMVEGGKRLPCWSREMVWSCWVLFTTYSQVACPSAESGLRVKFEVERDKKNEAGF